MVKVIFIFSIFNTEGFQVVHKNRITFYLANITETPLQYFLYWRESLLYSAWKVSAKLIDETQANSSSHIAIISRISSS